MRVRPTLDPHRVTVVHAGSTVVHRVDLAPGWTGTTVAQGGTVFYTPPAASAVVALNRLWSDSAGRVWSDATTRQWAA